MVAACRGGVGGGGFLAVVAAIGEADATLAMPVCSSVTVLVTATALPVAAMSITAVPVTAVSIAATFVGGWRARSIVIVLALTTAIITGAGRSLGRWIERWRICGQYWDRARIQVLC